MIVGRQSKTPTLWVGVSQKRPVFGSDSLL